MGAYVGRIGLKDGKGVMTSWTYVDGAKSLPSDEEIKRLRLPDCSGCLDQVPYGGA